MAVRELQRRMGLPNLVDPNAKTRVFQVTERKGFWQPVWTSFPFRRPGGWMRSLFGVGIEASGPVNAQNSYGGITVTPETALCLSTVWACTGRYQNTVSTLPLSLLQTTGADRAAAKPLPNHPLYRVLHDQPNSQQSATTFLKFLMGNYMTWGVGYAYKLRGSMGQVVGLKPLLSAYMTAYLDEQERLRYRYAPGSPRDEKDYAAEELFVVIDRTIDGYTPLSRIQYGANSLGMAIAGDRAANLAWKNGLRATGILSVAAWLKKDQRDAYRAKIEQFVGTGSGGPDDKQFGVLVAENATKFDAINIKPADIELLASRKFSIEDVCRWYDVPPILVSHSAEGQTMWGTGIEQIILGWLKMGLAPVLKTIEQEIWRQLLTEEEKADGLFAEFNLEALLRGDSAARANFMSSMVQNGLMTRNEGRGLDNRPPLPGGDVLTVQSNMTPLDKLGSIPASDAQQLRAALRAFLEVKEPSNGPEAKGS